MRGRRSNAAPLLYYIETRSDWEHSIMLGIFVTYWQPSSCAAVSTSIKTTISRKQRRLETWEQRLEIFYFLNATCFWGLKGKKPILLFSGEIPRERPRMTITNASPEAKQYNGFCAFISLVGSHKSSNKPPKKRPRGGLHQNITLAC